jgi:putative acetyltransferase
MSIEVREERPEDLEAVRQVNALAFGQELEGRIVDALRSNDAVLLSLVATIDGQVVGHILYSPITVGETFKGAALGPMSVLPDNQRQGIGSMLVEAGSRHLKDAGCPFIIVLGHPEYYPRFGFKPASAYGVKCQWDVPDNVFMVLALDPAKTRQIAGLATYRPEFSEAM